MQLPWLTPILCVNCAVFLKNFGVWIIIQHIATFSKMAMLHAGFVELTKHIFCENTRIIFIRIVNRYILTGRCTNATTRLCCFHAVVVIERSKIGTCPLCNIVSALSKKCFESNRTFSCPCSAVSASICLSLDLTRWLRTACLIFEAF